MGTVLKSSVSLLELQFLDIGFEGLVENTLLVEEVKLRVNLVYNDVNIGIILLDFNDLVEEDGAISEVRTSEILNLDVKSSDLDNFELVLSNIGVHKDVFVSGAFVLEKSVVDQGVVSSDLLVDQIQFHVKFFNKSFVRKSGDFLILINSAESI